MPLQDGIKFFDECRMELPEGPVVIKFPHSMSVESSEAVKALFLLQFSNIRRRAEDRTIAAVGEGEKK